MRDTHKGRTSYYLEDPCPLCKGKVVVTGRNAICSNCDTPITEELIKKSNKESSNEN